MDRKNSILITLIILTNISLVSAAHFIVGYVEDAIDSTSPNGRTIRVLNPATLEEIFGVIGPSGPSGASNVYMIDCEELTTPCKVNDTLNISLVDDSSGYIGKNNLTMNVTGAGFDLVGNISMNSPPLFINVTVEDSLPSPLNEIDLSPAVTTTVTCEAVVQDIEGGQSITSATSEFYTTPSFYGGSDDNNDHYTNSSCSIDSSFGFSNESKITCTYEVEYYSNAGLWDCMVRATDNYTSSSNLSDQTTINTLLGIGVNNSISFGVVGANSVSNESVIDVINYGNVDINLSLSGYGNSTEDGASMNCSSDTSIPIYETKYNLTLSTPGDITYSTFNQFYTNLSSTPITESFNLAFRSNDIENDARRDTFWRTYLPIGVSGDCKGNVVFGATQG